MNKKTNSKVVPNNKPVDAFPISKWVRALSEGEVVYRSIPPNRKEIKEVFYNHGQNIKS